MRATELANFIVSIFGAAAFLALAVLAASRGRRDPLARLLSLLCVDLVAYGTSEAIGALTPQRLWDWINTSTGSIAPALYYSLVIAFVGQRKKLFVPNVISLTYFGILAILSLTPIVYPRADAYVGGSAWAIAMLIGLLAVVVHGVWLLVRHNRAASMEEKARTRLMLASALIAAVANTTDLADLAGALWSPHLGSAGLVISAFALTAAALRIRMFERIGFLTGLNAGAIAITVVLAEIAVFRFVGDRSALAVALTVIVVLGAFVATRFIVSDYAKARERTLAHASLGRMAAQMAHDIKNPLASIRGAAQFLATERAQGRSIDEQNEFLDLLVQQCDRLTRIVDQYQRIGRGEPVLGKTDLNDAAREAMKFLTSRVTIDTRFADSLPACETDRDLLVIALENVLRNAHEAALERTVYVETGTATTASERDRAWVFVSVRDEGPGMDPRTRERALEGFFTTKSQGSGLGLAFVRRVVEAHRGKLLIESHEGVGTTVRIELRTVLA